MKKTLSVLMLLAALVVPWASKAQTLTVADGTQTNSYIPFYGLWMDESQHNQIIYVDSLLTAMEGSYITSLTWYQSQLSSSAWHAPVTIKLTTVAATTISSLLPVPDSAVTVWTGTVNGNDGLMTFILTTPFLYTDGNLLVDITTTGATYSSSYFYGITANNASFYSYGSYGSNTQSFLPKTTFSYNATGSICLPPSGVTFDTNSLNSLTFHWTAGASETAWQVMVGDSIVDNICNTTSTTVDGLNASTRYAVSVRAICGDGDTSIWSAPAYMTTVCAAITTLPWTCGFEGEVSGDIPLCWTRSQPFAALQYGGDTLYSPYAYVYDYSAHSGSNYLYFDYYDGGYSSSPISDTAVIASPYLAHNPADLHVTFWVYGSSFYDGSTLEAGIMTDPNDASTFVPMTLITPSDMPQYTWWQFEFYTNSLADSDFGFTDDDSACVAFRVAMGPNATMYLYVDDVVIDAAGDCIAPPLNSGNIDSVSYEGVQLSWSVEGEPDGFDVMLINTHTNAESHFEAADSVLLIENGLAPNTTYEAYAATLCGDDTTSYTYIGTFTTHYRCYAVVDPAVAALTSNAAQLVWSYTGTGIEPANVEIVLTDMADNTVFTTVNTTATNQTFTGLTEGHMYQAVFTTVCGEGDTSWSVSVQFMPHVPACAEVAGTGNNQYVPFYSLYNNGFTESLYEAAILAGVDTVTGISYEIATPLSRNNLIDIYMGYTTLSSLSTTNYVPVANMTRVVTNYSFNSGAAGWLDMIPFDTVFVTQPTGDSLNLVIAVYNHTGSWTSGLRWATHPSPIGYSVYCYTDNPVSPTNPWTGSTNTTPDAPNIQLYGNCGGGDCAAPSVSVTAVTQTTVDLDWLPGGSESSWQVQYRISGSTTWSNGGTALAAPYTITGLNPGSEYQVRLGAECTDTVVWSTAVGFNTLCGTMAAPFTIVPTGDNNCWTYAGNWYYYSYFYFYSGGSITTPALADSINTLQLKVYGYGDDFYVGISDDAGNITWYDTVSFSTTDYTPEYRKVYLHHYTGTGNHIVLKAQNGYLYTYLYEITVEPLDSCMPIEDLAVDSVTTSEAWLSWESDGTNFTVKYHAVSDLTGSWATATSTTNSIHLTGLNSNDRYWVKVFNTCSATDLSDSVMVRVDMGCTTFGVPFNEQFGQEDLPVCWNTQPAANNYDTWVGSAAYGYNYILSEAPYNTSTPCDDWVMTPEIQLPANADHYMLKYLYGGGPYSYASGAATQGSYEVYISTTGNGSVANYTTLLFADTIDTYNGASYNYYLYYKRLPLAAYAGQTVSFAFRNTSFNEGVVYIGDVTVDEFLEPIYSITGPDVNFMGDTAVFQAHYQEGVQDSITLQWTSTMAAAGHAVMSGATTEDMTIVYTAEGVDTVRFVVTNNYGSDTSWGLIYIYDCSPVSAFPLHESFETAEAPVGCWTLVYGDGNPTVNTMIHTNDLGYNMPDSIPDGNLVFRFSSMSNKTDYNQYLISRELNGMNMTLSFQYAKYNTSTESIRVGYSSTGRDTADFTWGPWISDSLSCYEWHTFTEAMPDGTKYFAIQYYGNYTYYVYIDDVTVTGVSAVCDEPVILTVTPDETTATVTYTGDVDNYEVAIVPAPWTEPVATSIVALTDTFYTFNGLTAETQYVIGVRAVCSSSRKSEWVKQTLTTLEHPCYMPTDVTLSDITYDGATLTWQPGENETAWEVHVYNTTYDETYSVSANTYDITGLTAGTVYQVAVRALCTATRYSDWTDAVNLTTETCAVPTGVTSSAITANSATISWNSTGATRYEVEYGTMGYVVGGGTIVPVNNATTITLTGLEEQTAYDVYVRGYCTETVVSEWSAKHQFTTATAGIDNVDASHVMLYPNPASSTVTLTGIEGEATVTVVDMNGRTVATYDVRNSELRIDVSGYAKGAYFVRVTGEQTTAIRKLVVK